MSESAPSSHPSVEKLRTFGLGQLDPQEASSVEEHVSHCEACCRTLAEVGTDTLVDLLRTARKSPPLVHESATVALTRPSEEDSAASPIGLPPELVDHPRYRVLALLGTGGMGAVYKAQHGLMERTVALKVMAGNLVGSPTMIERFRRESKAAARLSHPNIVAAHDAEQAGELHFLVMEYVEGTDLARLVQERGPLPIAEACDYVKQAAAGLQHAHEHGMIHRDIKPHNLMLTQQASGGRKPPEEERSGGLRPPLAGQVKILDFGLARLAGAASSQPGSATAQGTVLGTVDYMAPEQADDARQADIRSDIYSLGCTLYHLLSGRPPFPTGTLVQKIMAHTERQPASLLQLRSDVPPDLARVVERMMAKAPAQRYQTPAEVGAALEPFTYGVTVVAVAERPARPRPQGQEFIREALPARPGPGPRHRWPIALVLLGLLLGSLIAATVAVYRIQTDNGELVISTDNPDVEVVIKQNGKIVRIIDTKTGKEVKLESGLYELELKDKAEGLKLFPDKFTIRRGETVVATVERRLAKPSEKVGEVRRFLGHTGSVRAVTFSADGKFILSCSGPPQSDQTLRLWDVATGKELRKFEGHTSQVDALALSPDGRLALSGSEDKTARLWDVTTGKEVRQLEGEPGWIVAAAFSADGKQVLTGSHDKTMRLWDAATGKEVRRFEGHDGEVQGVAFSPDGKTLASASWDKTVRLWDAATGKEIRQLTGHTDIVHGVAFSPDGKRVLSGGLDRTLRLWDAPTGAGLSIFEGHTDRINGVAYSPDGRRALSVSHDKTVRLWDVETGKELHRFEGHTAPVWSVAFSPDGRYAVSASEDNTARLWRLPAPPAGK